MILGTLISIAAFFITVVFINPQTTNLLGLFFFYTSFFLSMLGIFSVAGFFFRVLFFRHEIHIQKVRLAFRQAFWLSLLLVIALLLQSSRILAWWNILILLLAFSIFESMFLLGGAKKTHRTAVTKPQTRPEIERHKIIDLE